MDAVEGNGNVIRLRLDRLEIGHDNLRTSQKEIDTRLDDKDKRDLRLEDKMDALQKSHERMTNWLMLTAGSILVAGVSAVLAVVLNT